MWFSLYAKERHWFKCPIFSNLSVSDENGVLNNWYLKATVVPAAVFHLLCCPVVGDAVMVPRIDAATDGTVDKEK